jgi:DNA-binding protein
MGDVCVCRRRLLCSLISLYSSIIRDDDRWSERILWAFLARVTLPVHQRHNHSVLFRSFVRVAALLDSALFRPASPLAAIRMAQRWRPRRRHNDREISTGNDCTHVILERRGGRENLRASDVMSWNSRVRNRWAKNRKIEKIKTGTEFYRKLLKSNKEIDYDWKRHDLISSFIYFHSLYYLFWFVRFFWGGGRGIT